MKYFLIGALLFSALSAEEFVIKELKGGLSGTSIYKMDIDQKSYVLRINEVEHNLELSLNLEASKIGISPVITAVSSNQKLVLMEYVDHPTLTLQEGENNIALLADTIRKVHAMSLDNPGESLLSKAGRCYTYLMELEWTPKENMKIALELIQNITEELPLAPHVCLHGDLNPRNIFIVDQRVLLIDWAEACLGDPFSDLTYLSLKLDFNATEETELLKHYLNRPVSKEELHRFNLHKKLHLAFWSLTDLYLAGSGDAINPNTPLSSWQHYQEIFSRGETLSSQYFFERSSLSLKMALLK